MVKKLKIKIYVFKHTYPPFKKDLLTPFKKEACTDFNLILIDDESFYFRNDTTQCMSLNNDPEQFQVIETSTQKKLYERNGNKFNFN